MILAINDLQEEFECLDRLLEIVQQPRVQAIVFTGNILRAEARGAEWERARAQNRRPEKTHPELVGERDNDAESFCRFFRTLNSVGVPVFIVPGKNDAPERFYLQAGFNAEIVAPHIHVVHRSFAPLGSYIVAGIGGEITDNEREAECFLMYPGWEVQFSLDFLRHLEQEKILLFHTPPEEALDDAQRHPAHAMVSQIIHTYDPRFAICSRDDGKQGNYVVGNTVVICPGSLSQGHYALFDTRKRGAVFRNLLKETVPIK